MFWWMTLKQPLGSDNPERYAAFASREDAEKFIDQEIESDRKQGPRWTTVLTLRD